MVDVTWNAIEENGKKRFRSFRVFSFCFFLATKLKRESDNTEFREEILNTGNFAYVNVCPITPLYQPS